MSSPSSVVTHHPLPQFRVGFVIISMVFEYDVTEKLIKIKEQQMKLCNILLLSYMPVLNNNYVSEIALMLAVRAPIHGNSV